MQWTVHGERTIYDSRWCSLRLLDVEVPGGTRFEHHVLRSPGAAVGTVVQGDDDGVLLMYRHRVLTGHWGWEIPAGGADAGEALADAAARETLEETGWKPEGLVPLFAYDPMNGISDQRFALFLADGAVHVGEPEDASESSRVEWVPRARVRSLIRDGEVPDGLTLTALLWWLTFDRG